MIPAVYIYAPRAQPGTSRGTPQPGSPSAILFFFFCVFMFNPNPSSLAKAVPCTSEVPFADLQDLRVAAKRPTGLVQ